MKLPISDKDKTLQAMDVAIEAKSNNGRHRPYLGMSSLGHECSRYLWYGFRWAQKSNFEAKTLKNFEDGHRTEDLMADRIRLVDGVTLMTLDPDTGKQIEWVDFGGHLMGHCDGIVTGIKQAPSNPHIWENKSVNEKKFKKLEKLRAANEKTALKLWDETYYSQQVLYMDYGGFDRAWMTVTTPGGRDDTAVRTESDPAYAAKLRAKAERIIFTDEAPDPYSQSDKIPPCVWCPFQDICRGRKAADRNCRTCAHVSVERDGTWKCTKKDKALDRWEQEKGCAEHLYNPSFVPGEIVNANKEENWIEYKMKDGNIWRDEG